MYSRVTRERGEADPARRNGAFLWEAAILGRDLACVWELWTQPWGGPAFPWGRGKWNVTCLMLLQLLPNLPLSSFDFWRGGVQEKRWASQVAGVSH